MIAYQIVIKDDPVSEEYARISRESFQPAIDAGIIEEIRTFHAITPDSVDFEEHLSRYNWQTSIMQADLHGSAPDDHSPTEKAGMCSHWELMRMASESDERFLVLEHDTFLIEEHLDVLTSIIKFIEEMDVLYGNIGLFMGCYTLEKETAAWQYDMLTQGNFPINCGPYCTLQRLYSTYTTRVLKYENYRGRETTIVHPWHGCDTLHFGRNIQKPFNKMDPNITFNPWRTPTTQVISKKLCVTQDHHGYNQKYIDAPWTRHHYFHIID